MPASLKRGVLQAEISIAAGRSILSKLRQNMPLRASNTMYPDDSGSVFFYILNPAAGLLEGDEHDIFLRVKDQAHAVVFGQGATKVFRAPEKKASRQFTTLIVEAGGRLEYMPEVVIPFSEASFISRTNVLLSKGSSAFFWEITAPGRVAYGEQFEYTLFDQRTNIYLDNHLIFSDRFYLEPDKVPDSLKNWQSPLGILHGFSHSGTFWVIDPRLKKAALQFLCRNTEEEECFTQKLSHKHKVLLAGTALNEEAYCFRALGSSADDIQEAFKELWELLRKELYNEAAWPWRKY